MKHSFLKCCLCCNQTFETKLAFAEHLSNVLSNLSCPVCNNKWSSLAHLIEHLTLDDCEPDNSLIANSQETNDNDPDIENPCSILKTYEIDDDANVENISECKYSGTSNQLVDGATNALVTEGSVYLEILDKDKVKCLPTQELKLLSGGRDADQFVIMSQGGSDVNLENAVIPSQNSDGTISLQAISEFKFESAETVIAPSENEAEDNQEELYSCNTCGVSFSSVLEHIQTYHNDQEVVVEESLKDEEMPLESYDIFEADDSVMVKQEVTKHKILSNGEIVDATEVDDTLEAEIDNAEEKNQAAEKTGKQGSRYVKIEKFCDSFVKSINPPEKGGPSHKVIVKEVVMYGEAYVCTLCNINVSNLQDFKNHPCKTFKYKCPHCPVSYDNSKSLCAHMKVHKVKTGNLIPAPSPSENFECEICNTMFQTNKSLKLHKRMHDPIKTRPIDPPVETSEGTEGDCVRYHCNVCQKMIPIDYRSIHQNSHKTDDRMNCGICNKKFHSNEYLEMHMTVHNLDKVPVNKSDKSLPYSCLYCDRRFARPHEKVKHERIHTGEKPHSCEICGKSFRVAYCLTLHMRTHTGARPYACPLCGKRFKAHSVYNHHLLTHSSVRRYKCPYCPKAFKTSVQLAGHKNSHTKPFSCTHCNRPFASLYAVRVHTETHARQNNLKFSCAQCGASYARAFALKDHMKQVHQQDVDTSALNAARDQAQAQSSIKESLDEEMKI
ncbi:unnamed protein product [Chilo suppressalis]|uniref:C2H2-type domain-containing protein n=1 Tax=Chilo suppressalis TaxID=168631 RepID=A0ABN8LCF3_CHISP|nr:unnamed protein product [Chilo suppressalis]